MPAQSLNHHTNSSVPASEPAPPPFTSASMAQTMLQITQLLSIGTYLEVEPRRLMIITPIRSTDDTSGCRVCDRASVSLRRWEHLPGCRLTSPAQTHHLLLGIWVIGWRLSKCLTMAGVIDARRCRNFSPPPFLVLLLLLLIFHLLQTSSRRSSSQATGLVQDNSSCYLPDDGSIRSTVVRGGEEVVFMEIYCILSLTNHPEVVATETVSMLMCSRWKKKKKKTLDKKARNLNQNHDRTLCCMRKVVYISDLPCLTPFLWSTKTFKMTYYILMQNVLRHFNLKRVNLQNYVMF